MTNEKIIILGIIGRISPEKNTRKILEILNRYYKNKYIIKIAGLVDNIYSKKLYDEYKKNVGIHEIEWLGWIPQYKLSSFYDSVDVVIILSNCIENGPLTLYESLHHKKIIIISNTPNILNIIEDNVNGFVIDMNSIEQSFLDKLEKIPDVVNGLIKLNFEKFKVKSIDDYVSNMINIYEEL